MSSSYHTRMPFGKHRGCYLSQIETQYLIWLWENISLREPLRSAVLKELRAREEDIHDRAPVRLDTDVAKQIVEAGRRSLANRHHPDRGGDHTTMQRINTTADAMLEGLR